MRICLDKGTNYYPTCRFEYVCVCWLLDFLLLDILDRHIRNMVLVCITIQNDCRTKHL